MPNHHDQAYLDGFQEGAVQVWVLIRRLGKKARPALMRALKGLEVMDHSSFANGLRAAYRAALEL